MKIEDIKKDDRPREKLINEGPKNLSEVELLAIMLSSGTKNESVMDLSKRLIDDYGLERLFRMNYKELERISGIKMAKATKLLATFEIARRILSSNVNDIILSNAGEIFRYIRGEYSFIEYELLTVILVNPKLQVIDKRFYSNNRQDLISLNIKEIMTYALEKNAYGLIIIHNHPGGNIKPSNSDINATMDFISASKLLGIHFLDHIIISDDKYYSFSENWNKYNN